MHRFVLSRGVPAVGECEHEPSCEFQRRRWSAADAAALRRRCRSQHLQGMERCEAQMGTATARKAVGGQHITVAVHKHGGAATSHSHIACTASCSQHCAPLCIASLMVKSQCTRPLQARAVLLTSRRIHTARFQGARVSAHRTRSLSPFFEAGLLIRR